jgi:histidine ammonia-lyase
MIQIDGTSLTIEEIVCTARGGEEISLSTPARARMLESHDWLARIVQSDRPVYGINTGFGVFVDRRISTQETKQLNRNLILSHAVGTGPDLPLDVVRAAMLIRANSLATGYSGVRPILVDTLIAMLNRGVIPAVPAQGSLGSSGDLAPLAHLALVLSAGESDREEESGWAYYGEPTPQKIPGEQAMAVAGLTRLELSHKEGLALTNGATFSAAVAALAVADAEHLFRAAEISLSMSLEALLGIAAAFDPRLHAARNHPGAQAVAERVRQLTAGSTLLDGDASSGEVRVQDAYSLRCAPQVQGAAWDTLAHVRAVISREINAATDNPLLFSPGEVISGGNFHGEPVGMAMDFLGIAAAEVAAISERRVYRLVDGKTNAGLPPMLVDSHNAAGLNSGAMMLQYTAASLVLENQTLAHPDSVHSLPVSAGQEDHNANSLTAAMHARQILENCAHVLGIEVYCAARALDLRLRQLPTAKMGPGVARAHAQVREIVPYRPGDAWWGPEVEAVKLLVLHNKFARI